MTQEQIKLVTDALFLIRTNGDLSASAAGLKDRRLNRERAIECLRKVLGWSEEELETLYQEEKFR